jgi:Leucine-rich repeat (LRR) protein
MGSDHLEPIIEVNCSYRGLTELPLDLPPKTKIIRLEGNEIEDLKLLKQDPIYRKALDLYLDNNKVKSIEELEGSYWLRHFRVFSLSGNRLTEVIIVSLLNW